MCRKLTTLKQIVGNNCFCAKDTEQRNSDKLLLTGWKQYTYNKTQSTIIPAQCTIKSGSAAAATGGQTRFGYTQAEKGL